MAVFIVEVEFHTICAGQLAVNVMHFAGDTAETDKFIIARDMVRAIDLTDANVGFDAEKYMAPMCDNCFLSSLSARVVGAAPGSKYPKLYTPGTYVGDQVDTLYSTTVAANIKLVTATGPDFTGRVFLPGVPETAIIENRFQEAYVDDIQQWTSDLQAGVEVGAVNFATHVYNRTTKTSEVVTNIDLMPNPGTIRKRATPY